MSDVIDLAHVEPFDIGELHVEPATRSIRNQGEEELVEPRVLQLLVALFEARGGVLSRYDLIRNVWGGRIVGENAIQRAVSRLRSIAANIGGGSFTIETIKGVGYKLVAEDLGLPKHLRNKTSIGRRAVLAGVGLSAVTALGAAWFSKPWFVRTGGLSEHLFQRAEVARRDQEDRNSAQQAVALYRQALREHPRMAKAWGGLALAYKQLVDVEIDAHVTRNAELALAAADQALEVDRDQPEARLAKIGTPPAFGHWEKRITALRSIDGGDQGWALQSELSWSLASMGQFSKAINIVRHALAVEPTLPAAQTGLFRLLWSTGRLLEAERVLDDALNTWPRRWSLWNAKFQYLVLTQRTSDARNFLHSESNLPNNLSPDAIDKRMRAVQILSGEDDNGRNELINAYVEDCRKTCAAVPNASMMLAALGATSTLFNVLHGYYFASPPIGRQLTRYSRRWTAFLFMPPFESVRADKRFTGLMERIGLPTSLE